MAKKNVTFSIGTVLVLLGALIGIIAIFMTWFSTSADLWITTLSTKYTGMEFVTKDTGMDGFQSYCPLIAWIIAILITVLNIVPMVGVKLDCKIRNTATLIFGILIICFVIIWGVWQPFSSLNMKMFDHADIGVWLMIASGAIAVVGSGLNFYMKE